MLSYGKNVLLSTNPKEIRKVYLSKSKKDAEVFEYLKNNQIHYINVDNQMLNKMTKENHQGIVFERDDFQYQSLENLYDKSFIVLLDHL